MPQPVYYGTDIPNRAKVFEDIRLTPYYYVLGLWRKSSAGRFFPVAGITSYAYGEGRDTLPHLFTINADAPALPLPFPYGQVSTPFLRYIEVRPIVHDAANPPTFSCRVDNTNLGLYFIEKYYPNLYASLTFSYDNNSAGKQGYPLFETEAFGKVIDLAFTETELTFTADVLGLGQKANSNVWDANIYSFRAYV